MKPTLIYVWEHDKVRWRLLSLAHHTAGYVDAFVVEKADKDALGDERWNEAAQWDSKGAAMPNQALSREAATALGHAIRDLVAWNAEGLLCTTCWKVGIAPPAELGAPPEMKGPCSIGVSIEHEGRFVRLTMKAPQAPVYQTPLTPAAARDLAKSLERCADLAERCAAEKAVSK